MLEWNIAYNCQNTYQKMAYNIMYTLAYNIICQSSVLELYCVLAMYTRRQHMILYGRAHNIAEYHMVVSYGKAHNIAEYHMVQHTIQLNIILLSYAYGKAHNIAEYHMVSSSVLELHCVLAMYTRRQHMISCSTQMMGDV